MGLRPDQPRASPEERDVPERAEGDAGRALDEEDVQRQDAHVGKRRPVQVAWTDSLKLF